jgi:hypothetical protein
MTESVFGPVQKWGTKKKLPPPAPRLCYVDDHESLVYFTDKPLVGPNAVWGDDWDDAPYEHNAGLPYDWTARYAYFDASIYTPCADMNNSPWSVANINSGQMPWLRRVDGDLDYPHQLYAGASVADFLAFVDAAGGVAVEVPRRVEDKRRGYCMRCKCVNVVLVDEWLCEDCSKDPASSLGHDPLCTFGHYTPQHPYLVGLCICDILLAARETSRPTTLEHTTVGMLVHDPRQCAGQERCSVHKRSDHSMRSFPQLWRADRNLMERTCPHGVGHPDPDHLWFVSHEYGPDEAATQQVHGCDGCCERAWPFDARV